MRRVPLAMSLSYVSEEPKRALLDGLGNEDKIILGRLASRRRGSAILRPARPVIRGCLFFAVLGSRLTFQLVGPSCLFG